MVDPAPDLAAGLGLAPALAERVAAVRSRFKAADAALLAEVVSAAVSASQAALLREVESVGRMVADTRAEIAALRVSDVAGFEIPAATDELDAVVSHTAAATDTILEACETLDDFASGLGELDAARLQAIVMTIYEACSFQDITGQRIRKVVATLKMIDAKVASLVAAGQSCVALPAPPEPLASGPQLPAAAMDQADVDQLLADLG